MIQISTIVENALNEIKAKDINTINVENITTVTSNMIIATGTSATHVKAIANSLVKCAKENNVTLFGCKSLASDKNGVIPMPPAIHIWSCSFTYFEEKWP